ncbi:MAG TPA: hypothetical protein VK157_06510 [Phycisphaerales bacterium]|nr:hypothetical protein [Phycisphaerales bacterium]
MSGRVFGGGECTRDVGLARPPLELVAADVAIERDLAEVKLVRDELAQQVVVVRGQLHGPLPGRFVHDPAAANCVARG